MIKIQIYSEISRKSYSYLQNLHSGVSTSERFLTVHSRREGDFSVLNHSHPVCFAICLPRLHPLPGLALHATVFLQANRLHALCIAISASCTTNMGRKERNEGQRRKLTMNPPVSLGAKSPISSIELSLMSYSFSELELRPKTAKVPL